jgi:Protein of unknown function (DUF3515)
VTAAVAAALLLAACSDRAVKVHPPSPNGPVAEHCAHLGNVLPQKLESLRPRVISPRSPLVHAWGSPAVVLTCGSGQPAGYSATSSETTEVDGVRWFQQQSSSTITWTAVVKADVPGKMVYATLEVPTHYDAQGAFLVDLAAPLKTALSSS